MGCVSTVDQKQQLKRTSYSENKPLDGKTTNQVDFQFLQYPSSIFKEEPGSSNKRKGSTVSPKRSRLSKNTESKQQRSENKPSQIQLEDPICNPLADEGDEMLNPYNTKSTIIKLSKKASNGKKKGQKQQNFRLQTPNDKDRNIIEGILANQTIVSSLILTHGDVNMEFTLSRCRAGPLTVPCIPYDHYNIN